VSVVPTYLLIYTTGNSAHVSRILDEHEGGELPVPSSGWSKHSTLSICCL